MFVMDTADNFNFCLELALSLSTTCFKGLNSNFFTIWKDTLVNIPKTTLTQEVSFREPIRCHCQLVIREWALHKPK